MKGNNKQNVSNRGNELWQRSQHKEIIKINSAMGILTNPNYLNFEIAVR